jgi:trans-aconitate methyltransferase
MSLVNDYRRQFGWRSWPIIFDELPPLSGQSVLDLGCAVGDQAAELVARGAHVIGVDASAELISEAQSRHLANAEFRQADLRSQVDLGTPVDGIWCSFTAAYFPNLSDLIGSWQRHLRLGGWIALTEIDDLFGHTPLSTKAKSLFEEYARDALLAGRYDFHMGRKLGNHLERSGLTIDKVLTVQDQELSFQGPASTEVVHAWRNRFNRMSLLRDACGTDFEQIREEFLNCLTRADHQSQAKVCLCIGKK